jgi:hypothetical protein
MRGPITCTLRDMLHLSHPCLPAVSLARPPRVSSTAPPLASTPSRVEPLVYHLVALHREHGHVHSMVTRRATGVLWPFDHLALLE